MLVLHHHQLVAGIVNTLPCKHFTQIEGLVLDAFTSRMAEREPKVLIRKVRPRRGQLLSLHLNLVVLDPVRRGDARQIESKAEERQRKSDAKEHSGPG